MLGVALTGAWLELVKGRQRAKVVQYCNSRAADSNLIACDLQCFTKMQAGVSHPPLSLKQDHLGGFGLRYRLSKIIAMIATSDQS